MVLCFLAWIHRLIVEQPTFYFIFFHLSDGAVHIELKCVTGFFHPIGWQHVQHFFFLFIEVCMLQLHQKGHFILTENILSRYLMLTEWIYNLYLLACGATYSTTSKQPFINLFSMLISCKYKKKNPNTILKKYFNTILAPFSPKSAFQKSHYTLF